jgi:alkanesulfonate monooxygenase SsuD/methylene tetrahydromethanopterin reductase-like flavin-dependent oxidoreductase (luciferase family)
MKVGVTLPQFADEADPALEAARRAEALGLDGVFCFDHLWPMGQPGRPALAAVPLLGALAAATTTIAIGSLVARVGLLPDEVLVSVLGSLSSLSGGRFIAGLGTGDHLSRAENEAYGIPFEPAAERRAHLSSVATASRDLGIPVWIGGGRPETVAVARHLSVAVNLWGAPLSQVAGLVTSGLEVTWGGPVGETVGEATIRLGEVAAAGATWAVCAWPDSLEVVAAAAEAVRAGERPGGPGGVSGGAGDRR